MNEVVNQRRSDCPINFAVEVLGDRWSLLIVRDMLFWGKKTYGEFLRSVEGIATNILAQRLAYLEREGIVTKSPDAADKRKDLYTITERGLDLLPVLIEMVAWTAKNEGWQHMEKYGTPVQYRLVERAVKTKNKAKFIKQTKKIIRHGGYVFEGVTKPEDQRKEATRS